MPKKVAKAKPSSRMVAKVDVIEEEAYSFDAITTGKNIDSVKVKPLEKKTTNQMSEHEYCSLIAARVLQLGTPGVVPMLTVKGPDGRESFDTNQIATEEIRAGLTRLIIRRTFQDGTYEDWTPKEMVLPRIGISYAR